jgi:hypothetical protein
MISALEAVNALVMHGNIFQNVAEAFDINDHRVSAFTKLKNPITDR